MGLRAPDRLIVNGPYDEPAQHWEYDPSSRTWSLPDGRRPAGYVEATPGSHDPNDPGVFRPLVLANRIRERVGAWRQDGYPGVTGVTRRLLEYWRDGNERPDRRLFFCQLEAIETLIWLAEAPEKDRTGIVVPGDGGPFARLCAKMATGTGKTTVMAMLIVWQVLNKVTYPRDRRFSRDVLVVAPGLTVARRLSVLVPGSEDNCYDEFQLVPPGLDDRLRQGGTCRVRVVNWQQMIWPTDAQLRRRKGVDKRGAVSDERFARDVLADLAGAHRLLVLNDEAHHAWRLPGAAKVSGLSREDIEQATRWIAGLDRMHRVRGILGCYDFSATPFVPGGGRNREDSLFDWIVSDFGLEDAIESGLVKTPRVVVRDDALPDAHTYRPRMFHIYADPEVHDDLNRPASPAAPLPTLVTNAYALLASDWAAAKERWQNHPVPPVMISVANRTETAARIRHAVAHRELGVPALWNDAATLHIDSKVLSAAEAVADVGVGGDEETVDADEVGSRSMTKVQRAEWLRQQVSTVGKPGKPGAPIQHVISVGMLTEGWDARTVTHIMGLRAFTSQLLCEQVIGRGLRRISYDVDAETGLLVPEYVNVFGVPFRFLPHEGSDVTPAPPLATTVVEPDARKLGFEIRFPNVVRVDRTVRHNLALDPTRMHRLELDASKAVLRADLAPALEGEPHVVGWAEVELRTLVESTRLQTVMFEAARRIYEQMRPSWSGTPGALMAQVVALVEDFTRSPLLAFQPKEWGEDNLRRRALLMLEMNRVVNHVWAAIEQQNTEQWQAVFDERKPVRSTADMRPWHTTRPCEAARRSHVNMCVFDSTWEATEAYALDHSDAVAAWVKNDHLGFEVAYVHRGTVRKYRPDFLVRLATGTMLVLEVKGVDSQEAQAKRGALDDWVKAANAHGGFGRWTAAVSRHPRDVSDILERSEGGSDHV